MAWYSSDSADATVAAQPPQPPPTPTAELFSKLNAGELQAGEGLLLEAVQPGTVHAVHPPTGEPQRPITH
jgi:hypothetical protein